MLFEDKKRILFLTLVVVVTVAIWVPLLRSQERMLTVSFLDVGQGDATFITTPSGRQVLIDGGSSEAVLRELGRHMSWLDRHIDVVVATHPDRDHIGGLVPLLERFAVDAFVRPGVLHETPETYALDERIVASDTKQIYARRGHVFELGDGVLLTILFPDRDVPNVSVNDASIVATLTYGEHAFLLTGDSPQSIEEYLVTLDGQQLQSDVLKVGHHGSQTSSSELFLGFVNPEYAVISRGCDNSYGHPHEEVIVRLTEQKIVLHDTCKKGTVTFASDGEVLNVKSSR